LKRTLLEPPLSLKTQIFPELDLWKNRLATGELEISLSLSGFFDLLDYFRIVILQDSVILRQKYPHLFIWNHPLFSSQEYLSFEGELQNAMRNAPEPQMATITQLVPEIAQSINNISAEVARSNAKVDQLNIRIDRVLRAQRILNSIQQVINERVEEDVVQDQNRQEEVERVHENMNMQLAPPPEILIARETGNYKMRRNIQMTVMDQWTEFNQGLDGYPPVRELAAGSNWKRNEAESRYYRNRRTIINEIDKMIENGLAEEEAVNVMEQKRSDKTLDWLIKEIRRERNRA
jgi:hypothetical protein